MPLVQVSSGHKTKIDFRFRYVSLSSSFCKIVYHSSLKYVTLSSGRMTATVLSPRGKLKVETRKPKKEEMEIAFTAVEEGKILLFRFDKFSLDL